MWNPSKILPFIHKVSGMCSCWASLQQKATLWLFCAPLRWNMTFATLLKTTCWKLNEFRSTNQVCPYGVTVAFVFQRIHHILVLRLCRVCLSNNALKDWKNGWGPSWNHQLETFFHQPKLGNSDFGLHELSLSQLKGFQLGPWPMATSHWGDSQRKSGFWRALTSYLFFQKKKIYNMYMCYSEQTCMSWTWQEWFVHENYLRLDA